MTRYSRNKRTKTSLLISRDVKTEQQMFRETELFGVSFARIAPWQRYKYK